MTSSMNLAFMQLQRRAEAADSATLVETFVNVGPLFDLLSGPDHQILYGRRGTGKTHALLYLSERVRASGDVAVYVDVRTIGSTGGLYGDQRLPIEERGTRLLIDLLEAIHDRLMDHILGAADVDDRIDVRAFDALDRLTESIVDVRVEGDVEVERTAGRTREDQRQRGAGLAVGAGGAEAQIGTERRVGDRAEATERMRETGVRRHRVHFGALHRVFDQLIGALGGARLWILIDEWSETPLDLQPLLADLLKRALFPVRGVTVKVAAIEQRSHFREPSGDGYIGIELGADAAADLDLDDFMVFGNDAERAREFFGELLLKHARSQLLDRGRPDAVPDTVGQFIGQAFTQRPVFDELVRAAEGVPRDAINVVSFAARRADDDPIGMPEVRAAARRWFQTDKEAAVAANPRARELLNWIIDKVIGERRARAFLLRQGDPQRHPLIRDLYDSRVLHVTKKGVAAQDQPGVRFDVYSLDYGCYVELMTTARAPQGLFEVDDPATGGDGRFVEVPQDDYRSIRRAILDLDEFEQELA